MPNGPQYSRGLSFLQTTEPTQGNNSGPSWHGTGEGTQYFHQDSMPQSHHGISDSFNFPASQMIHSGLPNARGSISNTPRSQWAELSPHGEAMSRLPSQDSIGAHSAANSYDQTRSVGPYPNVSQMSFNISSARSDVTGRSSPDNTALFTPTQQAELQTFDNYTFSGHPSFHRDSITDLASNASFTSGPSYQMMTTTADETHFLTETPGAIIYSSNPLHESPTWADNTAFPDSRRSSPTLEEWAQLPPAQMSPTNTDYSPTLECVSPGYNKEFPDFVDLPPYTTGDRITRKPSGPRPSKVTSDFRRLNGSSESSEEPIRYVGRSALEIDNSARDHALYQNVTVHADGLYHCPWEGKEGCTHKAEKLKCNYDKFVDSHLKPYRCKVVACENSRFSSTACLLRHEREAHAMHGHGDKPYLCTYEGCERGASGNGFPRHWNLRDHMRRVHNDPGTPPKGNGSVRGISPPQAPVPKGKSKRKAETSDVGKVVKRVATPDMIARQEPSLVDHYNQKRGNLLEIVHQLQDPMNADNMEILRNANDCIRVMVQTTQGIQRINAAPTNAAMAMRRNFSQQSG